MLDVSVLFHYSFTEGCYVFRRRHRTFEFVWIGKICNIVFNFQLNNNNDSGTKNEARKVWLELWQFLYGFLGTQAFT